MKKFNSFSCLYLSLLVCMLFGCKKHKCQVQVVHHRNLTSQELAFIPYQVNDTFSFSNGQGGNLKYICTSRQHSYNNPGDTTNCDPAYEFSYAYIYDQLMVDIKCQTDPNYNLNSSITNSGEYFFCGFSNSQGGVGAILQIDSACSLLSLNPAIYFKSVFYIDSITINNKKYSSLFKFIDATGDFNNLDTLFYSSQYGVLKFCLSNGEIWVKN